MHTRTSVLVLVMLATVWSAAAQEVPPPRLGPASGESLPPPQPLVPAVPPWQTAPPPIGFPGDPGPAAQVLTPVGDGDGRWGIAVEADLFVPQIRQRLQAPVNVGNLYMTTVQLPSAEQDLGGGLAFNLRFGKLGPGEFSATYRFLASSGDRWFPGFDPTGPSDLFTRLDVQTVDLDYSLKRQFGARWEAQLDVGAKLGSVFFDSFADGPMLSDHASNFFFGAGPHAALGLTRCLGDTGVSLFGRVDGGVLVGQVRQQFSETVFDANGNALAFGYTSQSSTRGIPVLQVKLGFSAAPFAGRWGRWQAGYQFEQWWSLAQVGQSSGNLILHGFFARYSFTY